MSQSCVLTPSVRTPEGEIKESRLFPAILSSVDNNRDRAIDIYFKTKSDKFQKNFSHLPKDVNGEFTLKSVVETGVFKDLNFDKAISAQKRKAGFVKKDGTTVSKDASLSNIRDTYQKAIKYNDASDEFVAIPKFKLNESGERVVYIDIEYRTPESTLLAEEMKNEIGLHNTILSALENENIAVGALDVLEEHELDNGVTDFTNLSRLNAEGILTLIRIAKNEKGIRALPEEFSHFVIEACTNHTLVKRLIDFVNNDESLHAILGDEYEKYNKRYNGSKERLAREAAAKLLAEHMRNVFKGESSQEVKARVKSSSSFLSRVWNGIKNFFGEKSKKTFEDIVKESEYLYREAANAALKGGLKYDVNQAKKQKWFNTSNAQSEAAERQKDLLRKIIENQTKRWKIAEARAPEAEEQVQNTGGISATGVIFGQTAGYTQKQRQLKESLESKMAEENFLMGIYEFVEQTHKGMLDALREIEEIDSITDREEKALSLRRTRDFIYSYSEILREIEDELREHPDNDPKYTKAIEDIQGAFNTMRALRTKYEVAASNIFKSFVEPYFRQRIDNPFSDEEMRDLSKILEGSSHDISIFDLWLRSASNSNNEVIRLLDQILKRARERGRQKTIEYRKRLEAIGMAARNAGIKDFDWIFEKDKNGHKSGNYIQELNYGEYDRALNEKIKELAEKYPKRYYGQDKINYEAELGAWIDANSEEDLITGDRIPKKSIYENERYTSMSSSEKEFYDEFIKIKQELDALLPTGKTDTFSAVKIRKDTLERALSGGKMTEVVAEAIKDRFIKRGDDVDVDYEEALVDFEGRRVNSLPVYYLKMREGESTDDLSTDAISTMIAYASMANDFYEMNNIVQSMELGRDLLLDRESGHRVGQTKGQKTVDEVLDYLGNKVHKQLKKENTNFEDRLNALYDMSLYSQRRKDEGTVGKSKVDKGKLADQLNAITALNTLALNLTAGITNVITGTAMLRLEAVAKEFMSYPDVLRGDRAYALAMPAFFAEYGKSIKTNKLSLFDEKFNIMQEYEGEIRNTNFDRKTWFKRMLEMDTLFFMNNCGEHWLQNRTALGLAFAYKMKGPNGEESNLWEALDTEYIDKSHPEYGARLVIKEGYTKPDGSEFTDDDVYEFTRKSAAINQRMHGIYNKEDMNVAQTIGLGRMAMLFRKYLVPSVDRRFRSEAIYNYDLGTWEQGYYITAFNFLGQLAKDVRQHKLDIALSWNNLTEPQKMNIKRAYTEVLYFLGILGALMLLGGTGDDRESRSFFLNEFELQLKRQRAEIGTLVPSPWLVNEGLKTLKSPAASIDVTEDMLATFGLFLPSNYMKTMQSGRYKGHTRAYKIFMTSPFVPMNSTIYKSLHPEEIIPFYNQ